MNFPYYEIFEILQILRHSRMSCFINPTTISNPNLQHMTVQAWYKVGYLIKFKNKQHVLKYVMANDPGKLENIS